MASKTFELGKRGLACVNLLRPPGEMENASLWIPANGADRIGVWPEWAIVALTALALCVAATQAFRDAGVPRRPRKPQANSQHPD